MIFPPPEIETAANFARKNQRPFTQMENEDCM